MPPQELTYGDWNSDTASSTNIAIDGDTFTLAQNNIIDTFESSLYESQGNTLLTYYTNAGSGVNRNTNAPVIEQNYSLKLDSTPSLVYSLPGDGLPRYFAKGEIASAFVYDDLGEPKLIFGAANDGNGLDCYMARHQAGSIISIEKWVDGGFSGTLASTSVSTNLQEWYELVVEWHDGTGAQSDDTLLVRLYSVDQSTGARVSEVANTSVVDSTYAAQEGVGYANSDTSTGAVSAYDNYRYQGDV